MAMPGPTSDIKRIGAEPKPVPTWIKRALNYDTSEGVVFACRKCHRRSVAIKRSRCPACGGKMQPQSNGRMARS